MLNAKSALPSRYACTCSLHLDTNATKCVCPSTTNQGRMMILNCSLPYLKRRTTPTNGESNRAFLPTRLPAPTVVIEESYQPTARHGQDAIRNITASSDNEEIVRVRRDVLEHLHMDAAASNTSSNSTVEDSCYAPQ